MVDIAGAIDVDVDADDDTGVDIEHVEAVVIAVA